jgi:CelD/BcsL family acetyltransferase involved in cellulose biosynthesis
MSLDSEAPVLSMFRPSELGPADLECWHTWHGSSPLALSPFVHPTFITAAGEVLPQTRVVVLRKAGETIGFLPLHIDGVQAMSAGGRYNDGDGLVLRPDVQGGDLKLDPLAMLRAFKLRSFVYLHLPTCPSPFTPFHHKTSPTARIDIGAGLAAYEQRLAERGSAVLSQLRRKARKLERECGRLRFELQAPVDALADTLVDWKNGQVAQRGDGTGVCGNELPALLKRLAQDPPSTGFASVLSALYASDRVVALNWSLRSRDHWVLSIPSHDPALEQYSPGAVAHLLLIEALCAQGGVTEIDLGLAVNPLKARLMTHSVDFAQGLVHTWPWVRAYCRVKTKARIIIKGA